MVNLTILLYECFWHWFHAPIPGKQQQDLGWFLLMADHRIGCRREHNQADFQGLDNQQVLILKNFKNVCGLVNGWVIRRKTMARQQIAHVRQNFFVVVDSIVETSSIIFVSFTRVYFLNLMSCLYSGSKILHNNQHRWWSWYLCHGSSFLWDCVNFFKQKLRSKV